MHRDRWRAGPAAAVALSRAASKSAGGRLAPGRFGERRTALQDPRLQRRRKPARRLAQPALEKLDHALGKRQLALGVEHIVGRQVVGDHEERHVAHDLRAGRHLDDVAEEQIDLCIRLAHLVPAGRQAEGLRLLEQVRVLAAGHLELIEVGRGRPRARLKRRIKSTHLLPVAAHLDQGGRIDAGVARGEP